jgi:hypothetical protein
MINNIVVISDTHFGCKLGLCPPEVILDEGGTYHHSSLQAKVWAMWNEFWEDWIPEVTKGEPYILVHNGDVIDGVHHNSVTQISHNIEDQTKIALQVLRPVIASSECYGYYHIRGTEAHIGSSGQYEEAIARQLHARPQIVGGKRNYARWELWLQFGRGKTLVHFTHHVGQTNSAAYESTAVYKELVEAYNEAGRWADKAPQAVVRSHRHRQFEIKIATEKGYSFSVVTPGWQLKTPFVYKIGLGRSTTPQIGGYLLRSGDEDVLYTRFKVWKIGRPPTVKI